MTKIQWTDESINFWSGCRKVSEGCKYCYMYRDKERYGKEPTDVVQVKENTIKSKLKKLKEPSLIFTCSWSDFFIEEADTWRAQAWKIIKDHPQHQWQILTKRPERILQCLPKDWGSGYANVWLGVSVENQHWLEERIPLLLQVPAAVRFLSCEPLLGELRFTSEDTSYLHGIDWVILGGESGNEKGKYRYRPCKVTWMERIIQECREVAVPVFVKQMGTYLAKELQLKDRMGGEMEEWPASLQVRAFPNQGILHPPATSPDRKESDTIEKKMTYQNAYNFLWERLMDIGRNKRRLPTKRECRMIIKYMEQLYKVPASFYIDRIVLDLEIYTELFINYKVLDPNDGKVEIHLFFQGKRERGNELNFYPDGERYMYQTFYTDKELQLLTQLTQSNSRFCRYGTNCNEE